MVHQTYYYIVLRQVTRLNYNNIDPVAYHNLRWQEHYI